MHNKIVLGLEAQTWIEMFWGLCFEGLLVAIIFYFFQKKEQKQSNKQLQDHLKKEDQMLQDNKQILEKSHTEILEQLRQIQYAQLAGHSCGASIAEIMQHKQQQKGGE